MSEKRTTSDLVSKRHLQLFWQLTKTNTGRYESIMAGEDFGIAATKEGTQMKNLLLEKGYAILREPEPRVPYEAPPRVLLPPPVPAAPALDEDAIARIVSQTVAATLEAVRTKPKT